MFEKFLAKAKKWNWGFFFVTICVCELGALGNKSIESTVEALIFGLAVGIIIGLPGAILTRDAN